MRPPLIERLIAHLCRRFGHKVAIRYDQRDASCARCRAVLAGPRTFDTWLARWLLEELR